MTTPTSIPLLLTLLAYHCPVIEQLTPWYVPLVKRPHRACHETLVFESALLASTNGEPPLMMLQIPDVNLAGDPMAADNLEQLPVSLVAIAPVEVNEGIS